MSSNKLYAEEAGPQVLTWLKILVHYPKKVHFSGNCG